MKETLDFTIWATSCIRFGHSKRLKKIESSLFFSLLMVSFYLACFSLLIPFFFENQAKELSLFITILSLLICLFVVLLKSAQHSERAKLQHECGRKIKRVLFDLKQTNKTDQSGLQKISTVYNDILDSYENHSKIDYLYFWYENYSKVVDEKQGEAPNWFLRAIYAPLLVSIFPITTNIISVLAPPLIFLLIISP